VAPDPEMIDGSSTLRRRGDLAAVEVDGETVVYDPAAEMLHHLDRTATAVWNGLDGTCTLSALAHELAVLFDADAGVVIDDVLVLARQLATDDLVAVDS
jgi:hypothetical protein